MENAFAPGLIIISPVYNSLNGLRQKVNGRHISPTLLLAVNLFPSSRVHLLRVLNLGAPWAHHGSTYSYRLTVRVILEKRGWTLGAPRLGKWTQADNLTHPGTQAQYPPHQLVAFQEDWEGLIRRGEWGSPTERWETVEGRRQEKGDVRWETWRGGNKLYLPVTCHHCSAVTV